MLHAEGSISGFVYLDADADGTRDGSDFGVPGIIVRLSDGEDVERSTFTDDLGFYNFDELEPGNYSVFDRLSSALIHADDVDAETTDVVLADDENSEENNFLKQGIRPEFINIQWFFASTSSPQQMLRESVAIAEDAAGNSSLAESIRSGGESPDEDSDQPDETNQGPAAVDDAFTIEEDNELRVEASSGVLENDTDPDGDTLSASLINQANNGLVTLNSDGSFTYTPDDDFSGEDTFTYSASDGVEADSAIVTITVTPAAPNTFTIDENSPDGTFVGRMVPEGDTNGSLTFEFNDPNVGSSFELDRQTGELTVAAGAVLDFETTPRFEFAVNVTNGATSTIDATVNLRNVNENAPVAQDDEYEVNEDNDLNVPAVTGVLANDDDSDGNILTASVVDQPDHGILVLTGNGSFTYEPEDNFAGTDRFSYEVSDGDFLDNGEVTIRVNAVNDLPVANSNSYATDQDDELTVNASNGVLANDSDADGDSLVAELVSQPNDGMVDLKEDGSFVYTPDAGFSGSDSFTYQANDGVATSNIGTVTINVNPSNRAPIAMDDDFSVGENGVLSIGTRHSLLVNDSDPDGDVLTAEIVGQAANGMVVVDPDGTFIYTPDVGFSGDDSFTYRANDGAASSNVATARIEVTPAVDGDNLFGPVTPGSFESADLRGIRTDLIPDAPPVTALHVDGDIDYTGYSNPPTYGPHHGFDPQGTDSNPGITPRPTGIYTTEQPEEDLIHNLEHGHVWISYNPNLITDRDLQLLELLVREGSPNVNGGGVGVILTPRAANDTMIALASWARLLTLDEFDSTTIRDFVETNRGQAPEGFITP